MNISDLPTRNEELPIYAESGKKFPFGQILLEMVIEGFPQKPNGFFDPEELVGRFYAPMSVSNHPRSLGRMVRAIQRSTFYSDFEDSDISEWLENRPLVIRMDGLPKEDVPLLLRTRMLPRPQWEACWAIPPQQQIDFETPTQVLGVEGVLVSASIIFLLADRSRKIGQPMPDYYAPDRFNQIQPGDSISIAFLLHRMVAGRIDGRTLAGSSFLGKCASAFGMFVENRRPFPDADEMILLSSGGTHTFRSPPSFRIYAGSAPTWIV